MAFLMKGADVANHIKTGLVKEVENLKKCGINPCLAVVRVGEKPDDIAYERGAKKKCEALGLECKNFIFNSGISEDEFISELKKINNNNEVDGILILRPLPKQIDENKIKFIIEPKKDVDCFNPINIEKIFEGADDGFAPCTPEGVIEMLKFNKIELEGKNVALIGRSMVVGKPLLMLLIKNNATVTLCHTRTKNLSQICKRADIIIAAAGCAKMVTSDFVKPGQVVVDVGINVDENGNLCGDVDFSEVEKTVAYISPVPGGCGSVTTSVLAKNVIKSAKGRL